MAVIYPPDLSGVERKIEEGTTGTPPHQNLVWGAGLWPGGNPFDKSFDPKGLRPDGLRASRSPR